MQMPFQGPVLRHCWSISVPRRHCEALDRRRPNRTPMYQRSISMICKVLPLTRYGCVTTRNPTDLTAIASIHKPRDRNAVKQGHQEGLQPSTLHRGLVVLPDALNIAIFRILTPHPRLRLLFRRRVVRAIIRHDGTAQHVVADDEPAGAEQAVLGAGKRLRENVGEVGRVARLLGIDEDEVVGLGGAKLGDARVMLGYRVASE